MKKTNALIAAALAASMLTACGGTDTEEMISAESTVSETTAATVSEKDTLSAESEEATSETTTETTEKETVEELIDEPVIETDDLDWEDEPITDDEPESPVEDSCPFVYKEFEYKDEENDHQIPVTQDSVPDEMIEAALSALETAGIERYDYFMSYDPTMSVEEIVESGNNVIDDYEYWLVDGKPRPTVWEALYRDFDHNGTNEAFILFRTPWYMAEVPSAEKPMCFLVFVNSDNEAQYLCGINGDIVGVLEYPEFTHVLVVRNGYNNISADGHIFAVNGNTATDVLHVGMTSEIGGFLGVDDNRVSVGYQMGEPTYYKWDHTTNTYVIEES